MYKFIISELDLDNNMIHLKKTFKSLLPIRIILSCANELDQDKDGHVSLADIGTSLVKVKDYFVNTVYHDFKRK